MYVFYQVSLWIPAVFVVVCAFLVVVPVYVAPFEVAMGLLITLIGIPFYQVGVVWKNKPKWVQHAIGVYTKIVLLLSLLALSLTLAIASNSALKALLTYLTYNFMSPHVNQYFSFI